MSSPKNENYPHLEKNIETLCEIEDGDTISIYDGLYSRVPYNSWYTSIYRRTNGDNKHSMIKDIECTVQIVLAENVEKADDAFVNKISRLENGLKNLRKTYYPNFEAMEITNVGESKDEFLNSLEQIIFLVYMKLIEFNPTVSSYVRRPETNKNMENTGYLLDLGPDELRQRTCSHEFEYDLSENDSNDELLDNESQPNNFLSEETPSSSENRSDTPSPEPEPKEISPEAEKVLESPRPSMDNEANSGHGKKFRHRLWRTRKNPRTESVMSSTEEPVAQTNPQTNPSSPTPQANPQANPQTKITTYITPEENFTRHCCLIC